MKKTTSLEEAPNYLKRSSLRKRPALKQKARDRLDKKKTLTKSGGAKRLAAKARAAKKPRSISKLKQDLDIAFGRFIKYRDGKMVDGQWVVPCITCGKEFVYRDRAGKRYTVIQAGHFMSRGYGATRFHEQNVNGQDGYCNKWLQGDQYNHGIQIDIKYGPGTAQKLHELSRTEFKFKKEWLEEKIAYYTEKIKPYEELWK